MTLQKKASPHTGLSADNVRAIRGQGKAGMDARDVADFWGVAPSTIRKIWRGETFRHVREGGGVTAEPEQTPEADLSGELLERLLAASEEGKARRG